MLCRKKSGEITSGFLVSVIVIVVSFALIFWFFSAQFNWTGTIDKEACHESVILRAAAPDVLGAKDLIPLKCQTKKVCIGVKGGLFSPSSDCEEVYGNVEGVKRVSVKNTLDISKAIATEMVEAWEIMGEGKVNIYPSPGGENFKSTGAPKHCVIYSRIAFDLDSLKKEKINLNDVDLGAYLEGYEKPGEKEVSYMQYFTDQGQPVKVSIRFNQSLIESGEVESFAILFVQISEGIDWTNVRFIDVLNILTGVGGIIKGMAAGEAIGLCSEFKSKGASRGCSVIRVVNYDVEDISKYCNTIESIV